MKDNTLRVLNVVEDEFHRLKLTCTADVITTFVNFESDDYVLVVHRGRALPCVIKEATKHMADINYGTLEYILTLTVIQIAN